jgi:DNA-binding transcriptional ArsR family regulator
MVREMDDALKAIAEPRRQEILRLVRDDEMSSGEIASHFDVSRPAISQHLRVLKDAGLVSERRDRQRRLYRVRPQRISELQEFLGSFWVTGLARLKHEAEAEQNRKEQRG